MNNRLFIITIILIFTLSCDKEKKYRHEMEGLIELEFEENGLNNDLFNYLNQYDLKIFPFKSENKEIGYLIVDPNYNEISIFSEGKFHYFISENKNDSILKIIDNNIE